MIPFFVIVDEILVRDMPKVVLSKEHQPVTTLRDRPDTLIVLTKANIKVSFFGSINWPN